MSARVLPQIRVGIVGAGSWAALAHIPAALENPDVDLVGIADRDPVRLAETADHYGIERRFADHLELIAAGLDALVIATPHRSHYPIARDALDAGLHLLIEKPLTVDATEARELEASARAAGRIILVGYVFNHTRGGAAAHHVVDSGELGDVLLVAGLFASPMLDYFFGRRGDEPAYVLGGPSPGTYSDPEAAGGGQAHSQVTHALGMMLWVTGLRARRVTALMANRGAAVDVVDAIVYELDNGALGTMAATGTLRLGQAEQQTLTYYGSSGTLEQDLLSGRVVVHRADGTSDEVASEISGDDAYPRDAPLRCLVRLIRGETTNPSPLASAVAAVDLLDAAYRSASDGGRPITIAS